MMLSIVVSVFIIFFIKQKTAYEMRISDWSSDVCSSDLALDGQVAACGGCFDAGNFSLADCRQQRNAAVVVVIHAHAQIDFTGAGIGVVRSEERRVGTEGVSTCRSRWSQAT